MLLQNSCYMCIQWTHVLYSDVITCQSNPPISQFNCPCNKFTSAQSMFPYNKNESRHSPSNFLYTKHLNDRPLLYQHGLKLLYMICKYTPNSGKTSKTTSNVLTECLKSKLLMH